MRIPVSVVVGQIAHGASFDEVLAGYPDLERQDIEEAQALRGRQLRYLQGWPRHAGQYRRAAGELQAITNALVRSMPGTRHPLLNVIVVDPRLSSRCSSSAGRVDAAGQEEE